MQLLSPRMFGLPIVLIIASLLFIAGCDKSESDWKEAGSTNTRQAYSDFISSHPNNQHDAEAAARIEKLDWNAASQANTAEAYRDYVATHPDGANAADAKGRVERIDWNAAASTNTARAYSDFVTRHPDSAYVSAAKKGIDTADWKDACLKNTDESFELYQTAHPNGLHVSDAAKMVDKLDWEKASSQKTIETVGAYLEHHKDGAYVGQAKASLENLRDESDWNAAVSSGTISAYQGFLQNRPNSSFAATARAKVEELSTLPGLKPTIDNGRANKALVATKTIDGATWLVFSIKDLTAKDASLFFGNVVVLPNNCFTTISSGMADRFTYADPDGLYMGENVHLLPHGVCSIHEGGQVKYAGMLDYSGSEYTFVGTVVLAGYTFKSDDKDPLVFKLVKDKGAVYMAGKGKVASADGKEMEFK